MKNTQHSPAPTPENQRVFTFLNMGLVSAMLACLAFILGKTIELLYPEWAVRGLWLLTFLIALESLIVYYTRERYTKFIENPFLSTAAEWVLILLFTKLFLMLQSGLSNFWPEVLSWQHHFVESFFDIEYGLLVFCVIIIWSLARIFSQPMIQLEEDHDLMEQEKLGITFNDRQEARRGLIGLIFALGFIMIGLTVLLKGNLKFVPFDTTPFKVFVFVLVAYFSLGFIFMALNQYSIMRARWYFNDISVNPDLARRWLFYTLIFIALVVVLIIFLPTNFTLGLYPMLQTAFKVLIYVFGIVQFILLLPISFVISLFNALLATGQSDQPVQPVMPEFTPAEPSTNAPLAWWDTVKSVLFWLVFISVIVLAVRYYVNNRKGLRDFFESIRIGGWLKDFWRWVRHGFHKVGQFTVETAQKGYDQVRRLLAERHVKLPALSDLVRRLPPRQAIILTYWDWVRWNRENGLPRKESQTPIEYAIALKEHWPAISVPLNSFTNQFIMARYTRMPIDRELASQAQELLKTLKAQVRSENLSSQTE
jgi:hypothetical protein